MDLYRELFRPVAEVIGVDNQVPIGR